MPPKCWYQAEIASLHVLVPIPKFENVAVPNGMLTENAIKKEKKKSKYFYSLEIPVNIFCLLEEMVVLCIEKSYEESKNQCTS